MGNWLPARSRISSAKNAVRSCSLVASLINLTQPLFILNVYCLLRDYYISRCLALTYIRQRSSDRFGQLLQLHRPIEFARLAYDPNPPFRLPGPGIPPSRFLPPLIASRSKRLTALRALAGAKVNTQGHRGATGPDSPRSCHEV